jgi:hypothetical protein
VSNRPPKFQAEWLDNAYFAHQNQKAAVLLLSSPSCLLVTRIGGSQIHRFIIIRNSKKTSFSMESSPIQKLPETAAFVELHLLDGGSFIASTDKLHAGVENETFRLYDWAFHIYHPGKGEHMLWDVGIGNVCFWLFLFPIIWIIQLDLPANRTRRIGQITHRG